MKKQIYTTIMLFSILTIFLSTSLVYAQPTTKIPVIVGFKDKQDQNLIATHGGTIKYNYKIINAIAASLPAQAIEALKQNPNVLYVEIVQEFQAIDAELDASWGVKRIGAGTVHQTNKGAGIQVAVLDTGIDYTHNDLDANYIGGIDYVNNDKDPLDDNGHGTHCAGIIAAEDNNEGVVGVAPQAGLYAVKVLNRRGSGYTDDIIAGIEWAMRGPDGTAGTDDDAEVISMSLGGPSYSSSIEAACIQALGSGTLVVASAGNEGDGNSETTEYSYPAAYESVIAVGATDQADHIASFSNTGPFLELVAPGVNVYSTLPTYRVTLSRYGYSYGALSGTSMACPHVAGVAALVFASGTDSAIDVRAQLDSTAENLGYSSNAQGNGLVDAIAAVEGTSSGKPTVSWVNPIEGMQVSESVAIQIAASDAEDPVEALKVEWQIDTGDWLLATYNSETGYYEDSWDSSLIDDNEYLLTARVTDSENNVETASVTITVSNEVVETGRMYVWDISWTTAGPHLKSIVTIHYDSDNDGISEETDAVVSNANIDYEIAFDGASNVYSGVTDAYGQFTVMWKRAPTGTCTGTVTSLTHSTYTWNPELDNDNQDTYP